MSDTLRPESRMAAAITLRVPNSGIPELDVMIREAERRDVAAQIMAGWISHPEVNNSWPRLAKEAVEGADALLAALRTKEEEK